METTCPIRSWWSELLALFLIAVTPAAAAPLEIVFTRHQFHPAARLLVMYGEEFCHVVGADGSRPQIDLYDKRRSVKGGSYVVDLSGTWAAGSIKILDVVSGPVLKQPVAVESGVRLGRPRYEGDEYVITFTSEQSHRACFLALVYDWAGSKPVVYIKELDDLKAGREQTVAFSFGKDWKRERVGRSTFPLFFSDGRQISDGLSSAVEHAERQLVRLHPEAVARHVAANADADREAVAYRQPRFVLTEALDPATLSDNGLAELTVESSGLVSEVRFSQGVPATFAREIEGGRARWLFLPALLHGRPVPVKILLPIRVSQN